MNRRQFLRTAGGASAVAAAAGASGPAAAQEEGGSGPPDYEGWFSDVGNYDETVDATGQDEVTIAVGASGNNGNFAFDPPAVKVDNGATVIWEWTGEGGNHNVVADGGSFSSGAAVAEAGTTFEQTFDSDGIYKYVCEPHVDLGMKGAVAVGSDYPTKDTGGGGGAGTPVDPEHMGVPFQAHFVGLSTVFAIFVSLVFTFFTLKYGESPNTEGGN